MNDTAGFSIQLTGPTLSKYVLHDSSDTTTWTTGCKVAANATGNATNIFCSIEAPESDLHYRGVAINYNVPTTMCQYLWVNPYGFYAQEVRDGPGQITYWVDRTGIIGVDNNNDGTVDTPNAVLSGGLPTTLAAIDKGKLTCLYDTSSLKGQNCCTGTYSLSVFQWDPTANAGAGGYSPNTSADQKWGGKPQNCFVGPKKDLATHFTKDDLPDSTVYYTDGVGFNADMNLATPDSKGHGSNVYLANYINAADHGVPAVPASYMAPITSDPANAPNPYYDFGCMDQAFEYKARIRVDIRDWNTYTEWSKKGTGDPNVIGLEAPPYNGAGNNDRLDWRDFEVAFPADAYPGQFL